MLVLHMNESNRHLTALFESSVDLDALILVWTLPSKRSVFFDNVADAVAHSTRCASNKDVYVGIGLRYDLTHTDIA